MVVQVIEEMVAQGSEEMVAQGGVAVQVSAMRRRKIWGEKAQEVC